LASYFKQALRSLRRSPGFALVCIACLGLGLGANIAVFSVVYSVLLRPLPVAEPESLVRVYDTYRSAEAEAESFSVSPGNFVRWREQDEVFAEVAAAMSSSAGLSGDGPPLQIHVAPVSANFFSVLGVSPVLGRTFSPEEDRPNGKAQVVVLSHGLWQRRFGADPSLLGRTVRIDGEARTVIGVMPSGFDFPREGTTRVDAWLPLNLDPEILPARNWHTLRVFARLSPGVSISQAQAAVDVVSQALVRAEPETHEGWGVRLAPLRDDLVGTVRPALVAFTGLTAFVLLIACLNIANLQLARTLTRTGEFSVRLALGGSRRELLRQFLAEGLVLSTLGGAVGAALTWLCIPPLIAMSPADLSLQGNVQLDFPVLVFGFLLAVLVGTLLALIPAWKVRHLQAGDSLHQMGSRSTSDAASRRTQRLLVVIELAVALMLLVGASLMLKSLSRLQEVDPGFEPRNVLTLGVSLPKASYPEPKQWVAFTEELLRKVRSMPDVESCGTALTLPMGQEIRAGFSVEGRSTPDDQVLVAHHRLISPGYLEAMRIPLLRGRAFDDTDRADSLPVAIVSQELARRYWPGEDPVGKRVKRGGIDSPFPWLTVVGVAGDVRDKGLDAEVEPTWYLPLAQSETPAFRLVVRTRTAPASLAPALRTAVWELDREQAVQDVATFDELLARSMAQRRFNASLLGVSATLGVSLALAGIYGVLSYLVSQRRREFGIRMSLGARSRQIVGLVVREGLLLTFSGALLGALLAIALGVLLSSLLFGISGHDGPTLVQTVLLFSAFALMASALPAYRATRLDITAILNQ
jgi:putative ABC transport system permease protein